MNRSNMDEAWAQAHIKRLVAEGRSEAEAQRIIENARRVAEQISPRYKQAAQLNAAAASTPGCRRRRLGSGRSRSRASRRPKWPRPSMYLAQ